MERIRRWTWTAVILLIWAVTASAQVVDCIVAEVNGRALTLTDIRILREFASGPRDKAGSLPGTLRESLEAAINRRVVIDLLREDVEVTQTDLDSLLSRWKDRFDSAEWQKKLAVYGLQEEALRPYLEEMIRYIKIIDLRFAQGVEVSRLEVERFYEESYVPSERARGREPVSLPEAASEIETRIRGEKAAEQAASWVQSLRTQAEVRINDRCLERDK